VPHRSWYSGSWWVGCYIWYSEVGSGRAHPSAASVPITVLLCGFTVAIKELRQVKACETYCNCRTWRTNPAKQTAAVSTCQLWALTQVDETPRRQLWTSPSRRTLSTTTYTHLTASASLHSHRTMLKPRGLGIGLSLSLEASASGSVWASKPLASSSTLANTSIESLS